MRVLPESAGRVCWANNLLARLALRWPTEQPRAWGQSFGLTVLDPFYVSLGLCLLAGLVLPARTLWLPVGKMVAARAPAQANNLLARFAHR